MNTENQQKSKKNIIILSLVLVIAVIAMLALYIGLKPKGQEGSKNIIVEVVGPGQEKKEFKINTDQEFLRGALEEKDLIQGSESEYGLFVTSVNGLEVDDSNQEWWCFTKGGEDLFTGVDETIIIDGDHFEITLTVGY